MQTKAMFYKTAASSSPQTRFYRSYKYKSILQTTRQIDQTTSQQTPYLSLTRKIIPQNKTATRTLFRKARSYSISKDQMTNRQKYDQFAAVQMKLQGVELRSVYMESYDRIVASNQKNSKEKAVTKTGRVHLPCIIDFDPSNFTALDPLHLPIEHIERGIKDLTQQLPLPKLQMSQIHHDMLIFQQKILTQLTQTQTLGLRQLDRLKKLLRSDMVLNQQNNMRFKRQCHELKIIDEQFKLNFSNTKPRLDVLQVEIFSNCPFELSRNVKLDQQFPQQYF